MSIHLPYSLALCLVALKVYHVLSLSLQVLTESVEMMVHQTKSLKMKSDSGHHSTLHNHNQLLLSLQLEALDSAVCKLQVTSLVSLNFFPTH